MSDITLPGVQKAIVQPDRMSTHVELIRNHPVPSIDKANHEHLIQVRTTAITNGELLWPKYYPPVDVNGNPRDLVPCDDVAGIVIDAPATSPFQPGTEVYARSSFVRPGCAREYAVLVTEEMAERPKRLSWAESAAVPMSAETAWQALFREAGLAPPPAKSGKGMKILVTAASGGVGVWVVQLAKLIGAEVIATCGSGSVQRLKDLGADEVLDHTKTSVKAWSEHERNRVDLVVDCIGRGALADAWWSVKDGSTLISIFQPPAEVRPQKLDHLEVKNLFFVMESNGAQLREVTALIETGSARPSLDSVFAFDRFEEAFAKVDSGKATGKVVLEILP